MSKKKICFIAQFPPPMHGLSKAVETLYNSSLTEEFELERIDLTNNKNFIKNLGLIWRSKADLFYFTISQTKNGNLRDLVIFKLLRLQHKKCLIHLHGGYYRQLVDNDLPRWQKNSNYKAISKLDGAIVLGASLKSIFQGMLPDDKIFVVSNCVDDMYLMSNRDFEEKIFTLDKRPVKHVLYLSNFIRTKGYLEVLEMAVMEKKRCEANTKDDKAGDANTADGNRKLSFDFAGKFFEKSEEDLFFRYISENALEGYVTYHGIVDGRDKKELLKKCDVFVLLTRYPNEGQPISILEAMGNGMMIVTTDHAGIPDVVKDGVNGVVVNKSALDIKRCYQMLLDKLKQTDMFRHIIKINRDSVLANYNQSNYIGNMENCMKWML